MKEEAYDFLEEHTITDLVKKYSQFINFPIHLWTSKTEKVGILPPLVLLICIDLWHIIVQRERGGG